jgi:hypothetical protein
MSAYHWNYVVHLAWFSNLTHQCGLFSLKDYLRRHPREIPFRITIMIIILILLIVAMVPTIYFNWNSSFVTTNPDSPAFCFYQPVIANQLYSDALSLAGVDNPKLENSVSFQSTIFLICIFVLNTTMRIIKLFEASSVFMRQTVRAPIRRRIRIIVFNIHEKRPKRITQGSWTLLVIKPLLAGYLLLGAMADFQSSTFFDVCASQTLLFKKPLC